MLGKTLFSAQNQHYLWSGDFRSLGPKSPFGSHPAPGSRPPVNETA